MSSIFPEAMRNNPRLKLDDLTGVINHIIFDLIFLAILIFWTSNSRVRM